MAATVFGTMSTAGQDCSKPCTLKIVSEDGKSFNYLINENDAGVISAYLYSIHGSPTGYKAEVCQCLETPCCYIGTFYHSY